MTHQTTGWQPIETAPRDGTEVFAWAGRKVVVRWYQGGYLAEWHHADADYGPQPQPTHWLPVREPASDA